jgi:hypothetical protein
LHRVRGMFFNVDIGVTNNKIKRGVVTGMGLFADFLAGQFGGLIP